MSQQHASSVPLVDLSLPDPTVAEQIRAACTDFGFMYGEKRMGWNDYMHPWKRRGQDGHVG